MANKVVAVFLMCIVMVAALNLSPAAAADLDDGAAKYKSCFEACHKECMNEANGFTFCEVRCDDNCSERVTLEKLGVVGVN